MTWEYDLTGLGTAEQTLDVYDHNGSKRGTDTRSDWPVSEREDFVRSTADDRMAALRSEIQTAIANNNIDTALSKMYEWMTINEDMTAERITQR